MKLNIFVLCLISTVTFAAETQFLKVNCLSTSEGSTSTFKGYIAGQLEFSGTSFLLSGTEIRSQKALIEKPECRDWYTVVVKDSSGILDYQKHRRNWNVISLKKSFGTTYLSCAQGSVITAFKTSAELIEFLTSYLLDPPNEKAVSKEGISHPSCMIDEMPRG